MSQHDSPSRDDDTQGHTFRGGFSAGADAEQDESTNDDTEGHRIMSPDPNARQDETADDSNGPASRY